MGKEAVLRGGDGGGGGRGCGGAERGRSLGRHLPPPPATGGGRGPCRPPSTAPGDHGTATRGGWSRADGPGSLRPFPRGAARGGLRLQGARVPAGPPRLEGARPQVSAEASPGGETSDEERGGSPAPRTCQSFRASSRVPAWPGRRTRHRSEHRPAPPAPPCALCLPVTLGARRTPSSERRDGETGRCDGLLICMLFLQAVNPVVTIHQSQSFGQF